MSEQTTKKIHRDIPNRTDEQLQKEYSFFKGYLQYVTDPGFERFLQVESELTRRQLRFPTTYNA